MIFWRIYNNELLPIHECDELGFSVNDKSMIPDEYLEKQKFVICRTAFGLGDWGIISALPRLLKQKYPNCKVFIPSEESLEEIFRQLRGNWPSWESPFKVAQTVFKNNPYIDGELDYIDGDIFHDHYRIFDPKNDRIPLVKQMLYFWQFTDDEIDDCQPELYFTDEEKEKGDEIINHVFGAKPYITFLLSDRYYDTKYKYRRADWEVKLKSKLSEYDNHSIFYWSTKPLEDTNFGDLLTKQTFDLHHVDVRIQLYIKTKAKANIGIQSGINDVIPKYAPVFTIVRDKLGSNNVIGETYI